MMSAAVTGSFFARPDGIAVRRHRHASAEGGCIAIRKLLRKEQP